MGKVKFYELKYDNASAQQKLTEVQGKYKILESEYDNFHVLNATIMDNTERNARKKEFIVNSLRSIEDTLNAILLAYDGTVIKTHYLLDLYKRIYRNIDLCDIFCYKDIEFFASLLGCKKTDKLYVIARYRWDGKLDIKEIENAFCIIRKLYTKIDACKIFDGHTHLTPTGATPILEKIRQDAKKKKLKDLV